MNFIDGNRRVEPVLLFACGEPAGIVPLIIFEIDDDGAGVGAEFGAKGVRIGFQRQEISVRAGDFEFVDGALFGVRKKKFPDAGRAARAHGVDAAVPAVEIADEADATRAWSPDSKV